ncbi:MAG TPA: DUF423 domain-containing protein [Opitutales bacterium]|jgi:uncharacterized membrane protein YgdD (TMEM256/DUF423 family)|nr:DUF423 domain-containing protein [Opitutales bacterium]
MSTNNKYTFYNKIVFLAAFLGLAGIILGAFGAHALHDTLEQTKMTSAWETAVEFQMIHVVALLALAAWGVARGSVASVKEHRWLKRTALCWFAGVILFSGSLYLLALGGPKVLGPVTPLGGLALMAGWMALAIATAVG